MRTATRRLSQVRAVPDLLAHLGAPGRTAWHHEVKLVTHTEDRPTWASLAPTDHVAGPRGNRDEEGHQAMTMTDPVADMLTRLRNANSAYHDAVTMPHSKIKVHIAEILQQEGYIAGWRVEDAEVGKTLVIALKYGPTRERSIAGIKRVSKPGLRVYARKDNLPRVLGGLGVAIISTSSGLMTDRQAKKHGVGGEVLAYVW
jgi:small subunit ribosomal protein S8